MAVIDSAELRRIADGPVATVYSRQHADLPVALKVFPKRLDKRTLAAFNKEQAKLSALRRVPSILPVSGVDELDTGEFAVRMELCTQSLADLVDRVGALPPADVVVLGWAVASALAAAHGAGVVHGGASPHNILFRTTGEPVLADFGVTLRQAFARDPLYAIEFLPPETVRTGELNDSTDLYGLGAVLHYALTGRSPHPGRLGEQPGERVLRILGEPVPAINDQNVPVALATLVARLLATDPDRRLGDATAVADQLGAMLPEAPPRPAVDDFDDFGEFGAPQPAPAPRPLPPAPVPALPPAPHPPAPPPYRADQFGDDADFEDFDDFAYRGAGAPPHVSGPPVVPPPVPVPVPVPVSPPPMPQPPVAARPLSAPPVSAPPVAPPAVSPLPVAARPVASQDEGADAHWMGNTDQAPAPAAPSPVEQSPEPVPVVHAEPVATVQPVAWHDQPDRSAPAKLPLAPLTPAPSGQDGSTRFDPMPTDVLPAPPTVEFPNQGRPRVSTAVARPDVDLDDEFTDFADPVRVRGRAKVLAGPLAPPGHSPKRLIRYDLLAGTALVLALLALVPLLLLRGDPEEMSSTPQLPPAGRSAQGDVKIELAEPVDLTDQVRLTWTANRELDFGVVVAAEGEKEPKVLLAERDHSKTVDVTPGVRYCFQVQGSDGGDVVYKSESVGLRGARCKE